LVVVVVAVVVVVLVYRIMVVRHGRRVVMVVTGGEDIMPIILLIISLHPVPFMLLLVKLVLQGMGGRGNGLRIKTLKGKQGQKGQMEKLLY
jgi:hypothetical protein